MMKQLNNILEKIECFIKILFSQTMAHILMSLSFVIFSCVLLMYPIREEDTITHTNKKPIENAVPEYNIGYYYKQMDSEMKKVYDTIYDGVLIHKRTIRIPPTKKETLEQVFYCLIFDNPELIYLSDTYSYDAKGTYVNTFYPVYTIGMQEASEKIKEINEKVDVIKNDVKNMTAYNKELYIHDYLLKKCNYYIGEDVDSSLYGALITGQTNCRGYSAAYTYLLNSCGIESGQIIGTIASNGVEEGHSWNFVILDEEYYYCDICWDDINLDDIDNKVMFHYSFFNMTFEEMTKTHNPSTQEKYLYPVNMTNSGKYSYMKQNGLYASNYKEVYDIIKSKIAMAKAFEKPLMIQCENEELYLRVCNNIDSMMQNAIKDTKTQVTHCKYIKIPSGNTLIIYEII